MSKWRSIKGGIQLDGALIYNPSFVETFYYISGGAEIEVLR